MESITISPKHRASITAATSMSVEMSNEIDGSGGHDSLSNTIQSIQHQHSLDQSINTSIRQVESSQFDVDLVIAEPLDKIFDHKMVREKRLEMEKKLESLRRKHDKDKVKIAASKLGSLDGNKKPKFSMTNKLVKRLSSKSL